MRWVRLKPSRDSTELASVPSLELPDLHLTDADDNGEQVLRVPDSIAPQQCRVGPYSGDDGLRRGGIPRHPLGPWLRSRSSRTSDLPPYLATRSNDSTDVRFARQQPSQAQESGAGPGAHELRRASR
jgi:hypothetical protein